MIKISVIFHSILYGQQKSEWIIDPENCKGVSDTIAYWMASGFKKIYSIKMEKV